jgi:hypothetical protein
MSRVRECMADTSGQCKAAEAKSRRLATLQTSTQPVHQNVQTLGQTEHGQSLVIVRPEKPPAVASKGNTLAAAAAAAGLPLRHSLKLSSQGPPAAKMPLLLSVLRLSWNSLMHTATSRVLSAWRSRRVHVLRNVRHLQIEQAHPMQGSNEWAVRCYGCS